MGFLKLLKNFAKIIQKNQNSLFTYDINKQKKYLSHFDEPKDDFERSYFQYKCQMKLLGRFFAIPINFVSFFITLIFLIKIQPSKKKIKKKNQDAVFLSNDINHNILPEILVIEYPNIIFGNNEDSLSLSSNDKIFLLKIIIKYPFSWLFILKCLLKISMYSSRIQNSNPKAIITYAEYSYTSSILTKYCEEQGIKHINVMHGEKLFTIRDSFFHFHNCYIWSEHYKNLFLELRAEKQQFIVSIPEALKFTKSFTKKKDYTYYLAGESKRELLTIKASLERFLEKGHKVSIRPHPRYTNYKLVNKIFDEFEIEDYTLISIEESVLSTKSAISLYSTVLNQAHYNGVEIIIDDITNPYKYKKLIELEYICLKKQHILISEEIRSLDIFGN